MCNAFLTYPFPAAEACLYRPLGRSTLLIIIIITFFPRMIEDHVAHLEQLCIFHEAEAVAKEATTCRMKRSDNFINHCPGAARINIGHFYLPITCVFHLSWLVFNVWLCGSCYSKMLWRNLIADINRHHG